MEIQRENKRDREQERIEVDRVGSKTDGIQEWQVSKERSDGGWFAHKIDRT